MHTAAMHLTIKGNIASTDSYGRFFLVYINKNLQARKAPGGIMHQYSFSNRHQPIKE
jgi:hypothetical protein